MRARQGESTEIMIKAGIMPIRGVMTGRAVAPILTVMLIILLMAGITIGGCALVLLILVTGLTSNLAVLSFQFERGKIVIQFCRSPAVRCMALTTVKPKTALMRFVITMTGIAIL